MEAFLVSFSTVAVAEMGDRTQLLALMLAAQFRRPWPIITGILCATLANHALAGYLGMRLGHLLTPRLLDAIVAASLVVMALWALRPDAAGDAPAQGGRAGAFTATCIAFFIAEIGDKTQVATMALAAAYANLAAVVAGTTLGMMTANVPVVFLGGAFADRLPLRALRVGTSLLFLGLGLLFAWRALAAQ
jgi:putative Ca2+/H+ antiporter (TMEM165/GDT1 family)